MRYMLRMLPSKNLTGLLETIKRPNYTTVQAQIIRLQDGDFPFAEWSCSEGHETPHMVNGIYKHLARKSEILSKGV